MPPPPHKITIRENLSTGAARDGTEGGSSPLNYA